MAKSFTGRRRVEEGVADVVDLDGRRREDDRRRHRFGRAVDAAGQRRDAAAQRRVFLVQAARVHSA